jgi:hypothetical protein
MATQKSGFELGVGSSLLEAPPSWVALLLLPHFLGSDLLNVFLLNKHWAALLSDDKTWQVLCKGMPHVHCPPELCGSATSWLGVYRFSLLPALKRLGPDFYTPAPTQPFSSRVVCRFRPHPESYDSAPPAAQHVHVPLHQRMQILRASGAPGANLSLLLGGGGASAKVDPWACASVEASCGGSAAENAAPPIAPALASASVLPSGPNSVLCIAPSLGLRNFSYHCVLPAAASQAETYASAARGLVFDFLNGINATIFAYGQTGSGKTFSMSGCGSETRVLPSAPQTARSAHSGGDPSFSGAGIIPRALSDILASLSSRGGGPSSWLLRVSIVEVYGEQVVDLLNGGRPVGPWSAAAAAAVAAGAVGVPVANAAAASALLERAEGAKRFARTDMNSRSSRAHTLCIADLTQHRSGVGGAVSSKLILADLGGSENIVDSGAIKCPERLKEAIAINCSLLALKRCISARLEPDGELLPPYADSRLTQLLQASLSGSSSRIGVLLAVRSEPRFVKHTLTALRFGEEVGALQGSSRGEAMEGGGGHLGPPPPALEALNSRLAHLEAEIKRGERWEGGRPVGVEGLREEYEAVLATRNALGIHAR